MTYELLVYVPYMLVYWLCTVCHTQSCGLDLRFSSNIFVSICVTAHYCSISVTFYFYHCLGLFNAAVPVCCCWDICVSVLGGGVRIIIIIIISH